MNPNAQQLERIVAYLDGELSPEESAQVERQLASDENFRQELQAAERAWSALDELPMPHVGDEFSRTTMEMVVDAAKLDVHAKTAALPVQNRKRKTTNALLLTAAVLFGALAARVISQNPNRRLLADLPVIQNVDIYSQFKSADFLRELQAKLGNDVEKFSADQQQLKTKVYDFQVVAVANTRQAWLESLPTDQQTSLRGKYNRFRDLPANKQDDYRALHQQIESADDQEQLVQTMYVYQQWINSLAPSEQYELRDLPDTDRANRAVEDMREAVNLRTFELTADQLDKLFDQVNPFIQKVIRDNEADFQDRFAGRSKKDRKRFESLPDRHKARWAFLFAMHNSPRHFRGFINTVMDALPPEMRDGFRRLPPGAKQETVFNWFRQYYAKSGGDRRSRQVTEQELADFFVEVLKSDEKERLLAMPRDEMQRELERMYLFKMPRRDREGPPDVDEGPMRMRVGPPEGRGPRGRFDGEGPPPPRGEGEGPPRFDNGPGRQPREFDRRPERGRRESDDRESARRRSRDEDSPRDDAG